MDCPDRMPYRGASRPPSQPPLPRHPHHLPLLLLANLLQRHFPHPQRAFHAEFAALGGEQGLEALELAAPEGFDVAVALAVAVGVEGDGAQLQAAVVGLAADFQAVAGGGGFAQDDPAGLRPGGGHAFADFVAEAGEALEHGLAAGEGGLLLEVGGEDGVASLGEFGELLRIAVGLAGGGALEQFGVFGGAQGGDFAGEVLQVFQALALLLVFAGGLGEVEDQAVEQQVAALRALFGFGACQSLEERLGAGLALQQLQFGDVPVDARQALFVRGVLLLAGAPLFQGHGRFVGLQALGEFALGFAEAFFGGGAGEGGEALGEQGFRVVAEDAVGQRMQGLPECRAGGIGPGVEGLEQGSGVFLEAAVLLARFRGLANGALFAFGEVALEEFAFDLHL